MNYAAMASPDNNVPEPDPIEDEFTATHFNGFGIQRRFGNGYILLEMGHHIDVAKELALQYSGKFPTRVYQIVEIRDVFDYPVWGEAHNNELKMFVIEEEIPF